jgi:hypothetical protein
MVWDERGTGAGWQVVMSASDFTAQIDDPTVPGVDSALRVSIPAAVALKMSASDLVQVAGQDAAGITLFPDAMVTNVGMPVVSAPRGTGMGQYTFSQNFALTLPRVLESSYVVSSAPGSQFAAGHAKRPGLFAGTYSVTINVQAVTAP